MAKTTSSPLQKELRSLLRTSGAHADFDAAFSDVLKPLRGKRVRGLPHSLWEILEHVRIAQRDILEYIKDRSYESPAWPEGYWPASAQPPAANSWAKSVSQCRADRDELVKLLESSRDPLAPLPGIKASLLHELLLVADHTSYHVGQAVLLRKLLGNWPD